MMLSSRLKELVVLVTGILNMLFPLMHLLLNAIDDCTLTISVIP